ncbi:MAG: hypothetical protein R2854_07915 [Caldilineaceae bacterium]
MAFTYTDRLTGVTGAAVDSVTRGTATTSILPILGWYDNGRRLLFSSDRENRTNLYSLELASGVITQLTDLAPLPLPREVEFLRACVSTVTNEAYFWHGYQLLALDLATLTTRVLYEMPQGWDVSMINATADGRYVCASISEDLSDRFPVDLLRGYVGFYETWRPTPAAASSGARP